mgnify:CR=1 FL=1
MSFASACSMMRSAWFAYLRNFRHISACVLHISVVIPLKTTLWSRTQILQTLLARCFRKLFKCFLSISLSHSAFARYLHLLFPTRFPITILTHTIFARCARLLVFCLLRWYFNTIFSRAVFLRYFHARITRIIFMRNFHAQSSRAIFTRNFHAQFSRVILKVIFTRYCQTLFSRAIFPQYCHTRFSRIIFTRYFHKLVIR